MLFISRFLSNVFISAFDDDDDAVRKETMKEKTMTEKTVVDWLLIIWILTNSIALYTANLHILSIYSLFQWYRWFLDVMRMCTCCSDRWEVYEQIITVHTHTQVADEWHLQIPFHSILLNFTRFAFVILLECIYSIVSLYWFH